MLVIGLLALVVSSCQSESGEKGNVSTSVESVPSVQRPATNPAHGQPFHDCALPVGAAFVTDEAPAQPEVQQQAAPSTQEVKLNPVHGAPGHRCELPVGAPLS